MSEIERVKLLARLELCAPALSTADQIAVLSHFWFTGSRLIAFNDQISLSTPLTTEFVGTISGKMLLNLVASSKAERVSITAGTSGAAIALASTKAELQSFGKEAFAFKPPKPPESGHVADDEKPWIEDWALFFASVEACLRSVTHDTSHGDFLGVTLIPDGPSHRLALYATDEKTLTAASVPIKSGSAKFERVILSEAFCQQMLSLSKRKALMTLRVYKDHAVFTSGKTVLWGSLVASDNPFNFAAHVERHCPPAVRKKLVDVPTKLLGIMERAMPFAESKADRTRTLVSERNGKLRFFTKSDHGEVIDHLLVGPEHAGLEIRVEPRVLRAGLDHYEKLLFTNDAVVMAKDQVVHLIAAGEG